MTPRKPNRPRPPCGTPQGYRAHLRRTEHACDPCGEANRLLVAGQRAAARAAKEAAEPPAPPVHVPSLGAFEQHRKAGETCELCSAYRSGYDRAIHRGRDLADVLKADIRRLQQALRYAGMTDRIAS